MCPVSTELNQSIECLHTISVNSVTIYFHYLTLNTTCFGRRWPSSGFHYAKPATLHLEL
jgi:hypothetical protein